jgi:hypothetical protein
MTTSDGLPSATTFRLPARTKLRMMEPNSTQLITNTHFDLEKLRQARADQPQHAVFPAARLLSACQLGQAPATYHTHVSEGVGTLKRLPIEVQHRYRKPSGVQTGQQSCCTCCGRARRVRQGRHAALEMTRLRYRYRTGSSIVIRMALGIQTAHLYIIEDLTRAQRRQTCDEICATLTFSIGASQTCGQHAPYIDVFTGRVAAGGSTCAHGRRRAGAVPTAGQQASRNSDWMGPSSCS